MIFPFGSYWDKARVSLLANTNIALFKFKILSLRDMAFELPGKTRIGSKYKQLHRVFIIFEMSMTSVNVLIAIIIPISNRNWILSMDRINWKFPTNKSI